MTSPLSFLAPAIALIGKNASVLPATGGAFEDMARPDVEEADDRFFGSKTDAKEGFQDFAETPAPTGVTCTARRLRFFATRNTSSATSATAPSRPTFWARLSKAIVLIHWN